MMTVGTRGDGEDCCRRVVEDRSGGGKGEGSLGDGAGKDGVGTALGAVLGGGEERQGKESEDEGERFKGRGGHGDVGDG